MQDSVGRRLTKARLAKGLSIEEVAHATRIRPDKIAALECGDYSRFGGNAYAKGFLVIYSRYLKVDASEETRLLEAPRTVSINDYQYLSNNDAPLPNEAPASYRPNRSSRPSALPLLIFTLFLGLAVAGFYVFVTAKRLDNPKDLQPLSTQKPKANAAPFPSPPTAPLSPPKPQSPTPTPAPPVSPITPITPPPAATTVAPETPAPPPTPAPTTAPAPTVSQPEPATPSGTATEPARKQPPLQPFQPNKR